MIPLKTKTKQGERILIYGPPGVGKTTLAAQFPKPLFFDFEGSTSHVDVPVIDASGWAEARGYLQDLLRNPEGYQTVVLDTADWAQAAAITAVCKANNKEDIEAWDYGKGYEKLAVEWSKMLAELTELARNGFNIVVLCHSHIKQFHPPNGDAYDRYELQLRSGRNPATNLSALTTQWADHMIFYNHEVVTTAGKGKAVKAEGGHHVLYAQFSPSWDAKNRGGLPARMLPKAETSEAAFACLAPLLQAAPPVAKVEPEPEPKPRGSTKVETVYQPEPKEEAKKPAEPDPKTFPVELYDCMTRTATTEEQLQLYIDKHMIPKGMVTAGMTAHVLPEHLVAKLVQFWDTKVITRIKELSA
jgi:hypothetical protein